MEIKKLILLISCIYHSLASEHSHTIPVEHYETELQDLGSHVESHHPPAKVIKITKTIAVKIPVPYPVKVIEKVPYPVHIAKPYPVPVPQIVHVPKHEAPPPKQHQELEALDAPAPHGYSQNLEQQSNQEEHPEHHEGQDYSGNYDYHQNFAGNDHEAPGPIYNFPSSYGYSSDNEHGSFETNNQHPTGNLNRFNYH